MKIEAYSFGNIKIDGETYRSDVVVYPDRVDSSWWRKEGHSLVVEDLTSVLAAKPDIIIVGTGYMGVLRVPEETTRLLVEKGFTVMAERTAKAVKLYNDLRKENRNVIAALHITC